MSDPFTLCLVCKEPMRRSALQSHKCRGKSGAPLGRGTGVVSAGDEDASQPRSPPPRSPRDSGKAVTTVQNTRTNNRQLLATTSPPPRTPPGTALSRPPGSSSPPGQNSRATLSERSDNAPPRGSGHSTASLGNENPHASAPRMESIATSERARSASIRSVEPQPPRIRISLSQGSTAETACERKSSDARGLDVDEWVPYQEHRLPFDSGTTADASSSSLSRSRSSNPTEPRGRRVPSSSSASSTSPLQRGLTEEGIPAAHSNAGGVAEEAPQPPRHRERAEHSQSTPREAAISAVADENAERRRSASSPSSGSSSSSRMPRQIELSPSMTPVAASPEPAPATQSSRSDHPQNYAHPSPPPPVSAEAGDPFERFCAQLRSILKPETERALAEYLQLRLRSPSPDWAEVTQKDREHAAYREKVDALTVEVHALRQWRAAQETREVQREARVAEMQRSLEDTRARLEAQQAATATLQDTVAALTEHSKAMVSAYQDLLNDVRRNCTQLQEHIDDALAEADSTVTANLEARDRVWAKELARLQNELAMVRQTITVPAPAALPQPPSPSATGVSDKTDVDPPPVAVPSSASAVMRHHHQRPQTREPRDVTSSEPAPPPARATGGPPSVFSDIALISSPEPRAPQANLARPTIPAMMTRAPLPNGRQDARVTGASPALATSTLNSHSSPGQTAPQRPGSSNGGAEQVLRRLFGPPTVVVPEAAWPGRVALSRGSSPFPRQ